MRLRAGLALGLVLFAGRGSIDRANHHRVPDHDRRDRPGRDYRRPGRKPLVHGVQRRQDRSNHDGRHGHGVSRGRAIPQFIVAGSDGNLWFTETSSARSGA